MTKMPGLARLLKQINKALERVDRAEREDLERVVHIERDPIARGAHTILTACVPDCPACRTERHYHDRRIGLGREQESIKNELARRALENDRKLARNRHVGRSKHDAAYWRRLLARGDLTIDQKAKEAGVSASAIKYQMKKIRQG